MTNQRNLFLQHLAQTSDFPVMLEVERASGSRVYDTGGKEYIDLISGISVSNTGHCHPDVVKAVQEQVEKYMHVMVYGEFVLSPQVQFARVLTGILPASLNSVYLVNSGSEAVEGALKLAKRATGRHEIIACKNAYHGSTNGAMSVMGNERMKRSFRPLLPEVRFISFNDLSGLDLISSSTACVIIEPIQGEAGIIIPGDSYLRLLREKCDKTGTLLIFDEIQTGFGRTGHMFAFEKFRVVPDILLVAKGIAGGMPLGAFIADKKLMDCFKTNPVLGHITTFGGHPVSCAAALANLNVILRENLVGSIEEKEKLFRKLLAHPAIREIRGTGLLLALQLRDFSQVQKALDFSLRNGIITDWFLFCDSAVRIAPPLVITSGEIHRACSVLNDAVAYAAG